MTAPPLSVSAQHRVALGRLARSTTLPHRTVTQARAVLWAADGVADEEIARRCRVDSDTVRRWRRRFAQRGTEGLGVIAPGRGRKPWLPDGTVAEVVRITQHEAPADTTTHWSTRAMAQRVGISKHTVARIWRDHGLTPWRVDPVKLSPDPPVEAKLVDVVGLYLDPPDHAAVFSVDETTQCPALDRAQPSLPMVPGRAGTMTHDDKRQGTTDLFAALTIATGAVLTHCQAGHGAIDVLSFFTRIDRAVPRDLDVHVVLDHLSAHQGPEVRARLAQPRQQRWHLHVTPTSSAWATLVERWSTELTDKRWRRGRFTSVADLVAAIGVWAEHGNDDPQPFVWHQTAADIIAKVQRGRATSHQIQSAADR